MMTLNELQLMHFILVCYSMIRVTVKSRSLQVHYLTFHIGK